jgi:hypothetical protein
VNQGLIFGETTLFINQSVALILVSVFTVSTFFVFIVNKITPLRVTEDRELGLDISQHGVSLKIINIKKKVLEVHLKDFFILDVTFLQLNFKYSATKNSCRSIISRIKTDLCEILELSKRLNSSIFL